MSRWWERSQPTDPIGLAEAIDQLKGRLGDDGVLRKNLRVVLGWLQAEKVGQIADSPRLELPMDIAARCDAYDRGIAKGIEEASMISDPEQLREVRDWLTEQATPKEGEE